jgi:hypothetical protein
MCRAFLSEAYQTKVEKRRVGLTYGETYPSVVNTAGDYA